MGDDTTLALQVFDLLLQDGIQLREDIVRSGLIRREPRLAPGALRIELVQHAGNLVQGKAQRGQLANAQHAQQILRSVVSVAVGLARRLIQQTDRVVVAQRAHGNAGKLCQFVALHGPSPSYVAARPWRRP